MEYDQTYTAKSREDLNVNNRDEKDVRIGIPDYDEVVIYNTDKNYVEVTRAKYIEEKVELELIKVDNTTGTVSEKNYDDLDVQVDQEEQGNVQVD